MQSVEHRETVHIKCWHKQVLRTGFLPQFSSVAQSRPTLCDLMDCTTPGFPVHHQLPELAQIHAHWVGDAIQPSHPLSSPFPPAFNLSQHQGLLQWVGSSSGGQRTGVSASASVLPMNIQNWFPLGWTGLISLQSKGLSRSNWINKSAYILLDLTAPGQRFLRVY